MQPLTQQTELFAFNATHIMQRSGINNTFLWFLIQNLHVKFIVTVYLEYSYQFNELYETLIFNKGI